MKRKPAVNFTMDLSGKIADLSAALMGAAFFLQAVFYLVVRPFSECSFGETLLCMILPLITAAAWLVLLRLFPLNMPRIFGILAAVVCLLLAIQGFFSGSILRALIGLLWYLLAGAAMVAVSFGFLPYRTLIPAFLLPAAAVRAVILYSSYIRPGHYLNGLPVLTGLLTVIAICCLSAMLKIKKNA